MPPTYRGIVDVGKCTWKSKQTYILLVGAFINLGRRICSMRATQDSFVFDSVKLRRAMGWLCKLAHSTLAHSVLGSRRWYIFIIEHISNVFTPVMATTKIKSIQKRRSKMPFAAGQMHIYSLVYSGLRRVKIDIKCSRKEGRTLSMDLAVWMCVENYVWYAHYPQSSIYPRMWARPRVVFAWNMGLSSFICLCLRLGISYTSLYYFLRLKTIWAFWAGGITCKIKYTITSQIKLYKDKTTKVNVQCNA